MTQMESPKRKMQKKNDYQRHKLFRKIKRRRKAQAKADQQVAMKQLRKKLKLPKFGDGKGIKSETGAPLEVKDGMLYYKETGEPFYSAGLLLPEVEIIGDKSKANPWAAAFFNEYRTKSINKFGTRLKSKSKDFIGYRNQGLFDRMDYPDWMTTSQKIKLSDIIDKGGATRTATNNSGLRGIIGRSGIKFGDYLQNFNYKNTDIYNYLNNLEVGKYIGAEPFDIQYDLPFHIQDHKINIGLGRTPTPLENKMYPQLLQFHNSGKDIHIKKSKRGTFTKAAKQHGMSVQGFANRVLRNPSKYSAAMRKKANFARNASKWNK